MSKTKLKQGLMERQKRDGVAGVVSALTRQPLRSTERKVLHKRKVTVVVDAECIVGDCGVTVVINGKDGDHYQHFVSDDLVSFLDESVDVVKKEVAALKDEGDLALIAKTDELVAKLKEE